MFTESRFTLIAGAGPTGLTLARELRRRGVPFRIVEQSATPFEGSRAKGLQPRTQEVLDDLGLIDAFRAHGGDYPPLLLHLPDGATHTRWMDEPRAATAEVPYPNALMVPQWRTAALLADGVPVECGVGVTSLRADAGGVHVTLSTGEVVTARYVVGCDGGQSTVRKQLGVPFEGDTYETERLDIADVRLTGLDRDHWHIWPGTGQSSFRLGLCPLPGTDDFQMYAPPSGLEPAELIASCAPGVTVTHVGWRSQFRANIRMVSRYRLGNVFLAGDAAHIHPPAGGQGLNTGIQDAYNLGWKIATGSPAILDTYEEERLPVAAGVLGISTTLHRRHLDGDEDAMRRDDPALRQLGVGYRGTSLSRESRTDPAGIRAGDRAPDGPAAGGRIFDLLRGPHATLLAVDWTDTLPASTAGLRTGHIDKGYGGTDRPTLFLVRPDGYVGYAGYDVDEALAYAATIAPAR